MSLEGADFCFHPVNVLFDLLHIAYDGVKDIDGRSLRILKPCKQPFPHRSRFFRPETLVI